MKIKNKFILLTTLILMSITYAARSQSQPELTVQYEFAVVDFQPFDRVLQISINGEAFQEEKIDKSEIKAYGDVNVALKEIRKMNKEGWEVFQAASVAGSTSIAKGYVFYLRRRI